MSASDLVFTQVCVGRLWSRCQFVVAQWARRARQDRAVRPSIEQKLSDPRSTNSSLASAPKTPLFSRRRPRLFKVCTLAVIELFSNTGLVITKDLIRNVVVPSKDCRKALLLNKQQFSQIRNKSKVKSPEGVSAEIDSARQEQEKD